MPKSRELERDCYFKINSLRLGSWNEEQYTTTTHLKKNLFSVSTHTAWLIVSCSISRYAAVGISVSPHKKPVKPVDKEPYLLQVVDFDAGCALAREVTVQGLFLF